MSASQKSSPSFVAGRYEENFATAIAMPQFVIATVTVENVARGIPGSGAACAISQWAYDMFGPECHPWTAQNQRTGLTTTRFTDVANNKRYESKVDGLIGGFHPAAFDRGSERAGPFVFHTAMLLPPPQSRPSRVMKDRAPSERKQRGQRAPRKWASF